MDGYIDSVTPHDDTSDIPQLKTVTALRIICGHTAEHGIPNEHGTANSHFFWKRSSDRNHQRNGFQWLSLKQSGRPIQRVHGLGDRASEQNKKRGEDTTGKNMREIHTKRMHNGPWQSIKWNAQWNAQCLVQPNRFLIGKSRPDGADRAVLTVSTVPFHALHSFRFGHRGEGRLTELSAVIHVLSGWT